MKKFLVIFVLLCMVNITAKVERLQQKRYRLALEKAEEARQKRRTTPLWHEDVGWTYDSKRPKWWPHGGAGYRRTPAITWGIVTPNRFLLDRYGR